MDSRNPATLFGGIWVRWGEGRVPVGVSENDSDFGTVEKAGGEKEHKLTKNEMPNHRHVGQYTHNTIYKNHTQKPTDPPSQAIIVEQGTREIAVQYNVVKDDVSSTPYYSSGSLPVHNIVYSEKVTSAYGVADDGGNVPHNNLQPYITCYMWRRTA